MKFCLIRKREKCTTNLEQQIQARGFGGAGGPFGGGTYTYSTSGFDGFSDIFGDLGDLFGFGTGRSSARNPNAPSKGADLKYSVNLTFEEAYSGVNKEINITRNEKCPTCSGTGAKPGTHPETCSICGGKGTVTKMQTTLLRTNAESTNNMFELPWNW